MNQIKFRGRSINGSWCHGDLMILKNPKEQNVNGWKPGSYISNGYGGCAAYSVRPETVGQYADVTDKDGKPLDWWEGDILGIEGEALYEIIKNKGCFWAKGIRRMEGHTSLLCNFVDDILVVIGNRYENPELLEAKDESD